MARACGRECRCSAAGRVDSEPDEAGAAHRLQPLRSETGISWTQIARARQHGPGRFDDEGAPHHGIIFQDGPASFAGGERAFVCQRRIQRALYPDRVYR